MEAQTPRREDGGGTAGHGKLSFEQQAVARVALVGCVGDGSVECERVGWALAALRTNRDQMTRWDEAFG